MVTFACQMTPGTGVYRETLKCEAVFWFSKAMTRKQYATRNEVRDLECCSDLRLHSLSWNCPNILNDLNSVNCISDQKFPSLATTILFSISVNLTILGTWYN